MDLFGCCGGSEQGAKAVSKAAEEQRGERVAEASALSKEGDRVHVKVQGRFISVIREKGVLHAIDSICYHAGGALGVGDIEDVDGSSCLICPLHQYKIDLATGDEIYKDGISGRWRRVKQQRTHQVKEVNGGVFVILSKGGPPLASDAYAFNAQLGNCVKHAGF